MLLDVRQLCESCLGQVLKEGVTHAGGSAGAAPGVGGGCVAGGGLPGSKRFPIAEDKVPPVAGVKPGYHWLGAVTFAGQDVGCLEEGIAIGDMGDVAIAPGSLQDGLEEEVLDSLHH